MKILRILLHSFMLAIVNIGSILAGFGIYQLFRPANQIAVQAPFAALFSIIAFLLWSFSIRRFAFEHLHFLGRNEFIWLYLLTLIWSPAIFIPLHYIGRGYLTSFGNIKGMWLFQIPTNFLVLLIVAKLVYSGKEVGKNTKEPAL